MEVLAEARCFTLRRGGGTHECQDLALCGSPFTRSCSFFPLSTNAHEPYCVHSSGVLGYGGEGAALGGPVTGGTETLKKPREDA